MELDVKIHRRKLIQIAQEIEKQIVANVDLIYWERQWMKMMSEEFTR